jgi:hypothetical protein
MASSEIAVSTTPPLPGTVLVQQINDAFQAVATQFSGAVDPAAYADAYMLWADTGTGNLKRRNAANSAWDIVGRIVPTLFEDASGNVGIGTSSPTERLTVEGTPSTFGDSRFNASFFDTTSASAGTGAGIAFSGWANGTTIGATYAQIKGIKENGTAGNTAGAFVISTIPNGGTPTERARIDSSGNFMVGTTSSGGTNGISLTPGAITGGVPYIILNKSASGGPFAVLNFQHNSANVGSVSLTNTITSYNTSSDYRLKENVAPMQNALATVAALKPCTYTWKADGSAGQGFIAHELQAVVPDCVTGEKDAVEIVDELDAEGKKIGEKEVPRYQGVDTSFLVATLVAAIQELKSEFDAYKAEHP